MKKRLTFRFAFFLVLVGTVLLFLNLDFMETPCKAHAATNNIRVEMTSPEIGFTFGPSKDTTVKNGDPFKFTVTLDPGYSKSTPHVEIGGVSYSVYKDLNMSSEPQYDAETRTYTYTIFKITRDGFLNDSIEITVTSIQKNTYTITFAAPNDTIQGFEDVAPMENVEHGEENRTFKVVRINSYSQKNLIARIGTTELVLKSKNGNEFEFYLPKVTDDFVVIIDLAIVTYTLTILPFDNIDGYTINSSNISNIEHGTTNLTFAITLRSSHNKTLPKMKISDDHYDATRIDNSDQYEFTIPFAIIEDTTIYIVTKLNEYAVTVEAANPASAQGFVAIAPFTVNHGEDNATFAIKRNVSHNATELSATVNGEELSFTLNKSTDEFTFTLPFVEEDLTVLITSKINCYKITLPSGEGYNIINIVGSADNIPHNSTFSFTVRVHESHEPVGELVTGQPNPIPGGNDYSYILTITNSISIAINVKAKIFILTATDNPYFDYVAGTFNNNSATVEYGKSLEFSIKLKTEANRSIPVFKTSDNSTWNYTSRDLVSGTYTFKITNITQNLEIMVVDSTVKINTYNINLPQSGRILGNTAWTTSTANSNLITHGGDFTFSVLFNAKFDNINFTIKVYNYNYETQTTLLNSFNKTDDNIYIITDIKCDILIEISTKDFHSYNITTELIGSPNGSVCISTGADLLANNPYNLLSKTDEIITLVFTPNSSHEIKTLTVGGIDFTQYLNTTGNHAIQDGELTIYESGKIEYTLTINKDITISIEFAEIKKDVEVYDIVFIEPSVKNGSVTFSQTQFQLNSTLVITFNPKMGNKFKNITINETPIEELISISNLQMSFKNNTFTIHVTEEWLDWACQSTVAWVNGNGALTLNVSVESEPSVIFLASLIGAGALAPVILALTVLFIISQRRKYNYKLALEKSKHNNNSNKSVYAIVDHIKVVRYGEYEQ